MMKNGFVEVVIQKCFHIICKSYKEFQVLITANNVSDLDQCTNFKYLKYRELNNIITEELTDNIFSNKINKSEYYSEEEFNIKFGNNDVFTSVKKDFLDILHINCRSIRSKFNEICNFVLNLKCNFDVLAMSETWLNEKDNLDLYNIDGYKMCNCNRGKKQGGGVVLFVKDTYESKIESKLSYALHEDLEVVTVTVTSNSTKKFTVACMYRAPNVSFENFNTTFCEYMEHVKNRNFYLCGDFNVNLLNFETSNETNSFVNSFFLAMDYVHLFIYQSDSKNKFYINR